MTNMENLNKNLETIDRGALYFKQLLLVFLFVGGANLIGGMLALVGSDYANQILGIVGGSGFPSAFMALVGAWAMLVGKNALEAISGLIKEMKEIV